MIGRTVGHYRLEAEPGRGGFDAVYRGVLAHLEDVRVAVGVFHRGSRVPERRAGREGPGGGPP